MVPSAISLPLALLALGAAARAAGPPAPFAIHAARVYTGESEIEDGTVLVVEGKIAAVGRALALPRGVRVIDLPGRAVLPGLIDSETTLAEGGQDTRKSLTPEVLAADGWDFFAERRLLIAGGVTAVYVSPGSSRLLSGRGMVVKTGGHDGDVERRVLRRAAGVRVTLGEYSKNPPPLYEPPVPPSPDRPFEPVDLQLPSSRAGEFMALRAVLGRARAYRKAVAARARGLAALSSPTEGPPFLEPDPEMAALLEVVEGKDRLRVKVDRAHDIERTLALAREMQIGVVLEGAREAYRIPELIARAGAPVIFRGAVQPGGHGDEDITRPSIAGQYREGTAAALAKAGVKLAIDSPTDSEVEDLLLEAAVAVREGLSPALALRAITLSAAEILGVAARVGSIAQGKDADLVIMPSPRPFGGEAPEALKPEAVYIDGELVYSAGPREYPPDAVVIRCGRVLTAEEEIPGGVILVRGGKILQVGPGALAAPLPEGAQVIDASGEVVIPGLIDAGSKVGVHLDVLAPSLFEEGRSAAAGGGRATYRLADALDPSDPAISAVLQSGITTAIIAPEPAGTIAGQLTALKLSGGPRSAALLKPEAGILFGSVRAEEVQRAHEYHDRWTAHEKAAEGKVPPPEPPQREEMLEPLRPLFSGKAVAVVLARSKGDIGPILRELADKHHIATVVYGPRELDEAAFDELKRRGAAVLLTPELLLRRPPPQPVLNLPRLASRSGTRFALRSGAAAGARQLPVEVALAVRAGWDAREALRAMTIDTARIFKIDDRVGSIEKGKDADLVFLTGDPFALSSRVTRVMVDGKMVYQEKAP
jgi:imidazolonepropionase-like amidohydrolase